MSLTFSEFFAYIVLAVFTAGMFFFVFMQRIIEWLEAREDRKKAKAETADPDPAVKPT